MIHWIQSFLDPFLKLQFVLKFIKVFFYVLYSIFDNKGSGYSNTEIEHKVNNTEQVKLYFT